MSTLHNATQKGELIDPSYEDLNISPCACSLIHFRVDPAVHNAIQDAGDLKGKVIAENGHVAGSLCEQVSHVKM